MTYFRLPDSIITTDHDIGGENTRSGRINKENTVPSFILLQANTLQSFKSLNTHGRSLYSHPGYNRGAHQGKHLF